MRVKTKAIALSGVLAISIVAFNHIPPTPAPAVALKPVIQTEAHYIDHAAVLSALTETPQLVGLTGTAEKTVGYKDAKWYGDKEYEMTVKGVFKLGVDTEDIEITTSGNTITVRFPQPVIISTDFPFDIADIKKDVGLLRGDLTEVELQALYGEARAGAIADIKADEEAFEKAEDVVEDTIEELIGMVTDSDKGITVKFTNNEVGVAE